MAEHKKHGVGIYVVVALILAVITYVEFAIVEYPVAWLTPGQTMFWLIAMSVVKFWMVIWFFMHLRDDPKVYTGFFSSGMFISMGTFVALSFMFVLPASVAPIANADEVEARAVVLAALRSGEAHEPAETDDHGAAPMQASRATPPSDRTLAVTPPAAATDGFEVDREARAAAAEPEPAAATTEPTPATTPSSVPPRTPPTASLATRPPAPVSPASSRPSPATPPTSTPPTVAAPTSSTSSSTASKAPSTSTAPPTTASCPPGRN